MFFTRQIFFFIVFSASLLSCEKPFSFSPFDAEVADHRKNTNAINLAEIASMPIKKQDTFKIALISDPHYHFNSLRDVVLEINKRRDISFVVALGDITENGLQSEFEIFQNIMGRLSVPYVTVIGNHDYLANGGEVYKQMYGPANFSFVFNGVKFIVFDNVLWESPSPPDYQWLEQELAESQAGKEYMAHSQVIMLSHIPPFDRQLEEKRDFFHQLLKQYGVRLSAHGHKHTFDIGEWSGVGVLYFTTGSPQFRTYAVLSLEGSDFQVEKVEY